MMMFLLVSILLISSCIWLNSEPFGRVTAGERLELVKQSPHYRQEIFQNEHNTPDLEIGVSFWSVLWHYFFEKEKRSTPTGTLPAVKTDLKRLPGEANVVVWMGHSSSFLQIDGKRILIDPVLSKAASPVSFINMAYSGTDIYKADDFPEIDVLLISHDHWDHLDYQTVKDLQPKIRKVICGLGVGEHFRRWGYKESQIEERDWNERVTVDSTLSVTVTPARHNSGRLFTMKQSLWASYVIKTPHFNIFFSGDTGYDTHFKAIGNMYGPFDLALMECGQYDKNYPYTHMQPEQSMQAALDVKAKRLLPVHWGKFTESNHAWDEPVEKISVLARQSGMRLMTPEIGQATALDSEVVFRRWWEGID